MRSAQQRKHRGHRILGEDHLAPEDEIVTEASLNALRHGAFAKAMLLDGEDPDELEYHRARLENDLKPQGETERRYFDGVMLWMWRILRYLRWQKQNQNDRDDYNVGLEIDVPARLAAEYDKAVRRFFQCRALRNALGYVREQGGPVAREKVKPALPAPPPSSPEADTATVDRAVDQPDDVPDREEKK